MGEQKYTLKLRMPLLLATVAVSLTLSALILVLPGQPALWMPFAAGSAMLIVAATWAATYTIILTEQELIFATLAGRNVVPLSTVVSLERVRFRVRHRWREGLRIRTADGNTCLVRPQVANWRDLEQQLHQRCTKVIA